MSSLFHQVFQRRHSLSNFVLNQIDRQTPMKSTQPSEEQLSSAPAQILNAGIAASLYLGVGGSMDVSRNRRFAELALLSITGPHSYFIFEIFELSDILFYLPDRTGYFD